MQHLDCSISKKLRAITAHKRVAIAPTDVEGTHATEL